MRLLKILFSRTILVVIGFIVQFALLFWFLFLPIDYLYIFQTVCMILAFFAFLDIINKNHPAEFKLPWLFTVLIFPVLGLFLYLTFANRRLSKRQIRELILARERIDQARLPALNEKAVKDFLGDDVGLENYLTSTNYSHGHLNNKITYIISNFSCSRRIHMRTFIIKISI